MRCRSQSLTNGKVRTVKKYTAATVDWIAVWDATTERCYYVPSAMLGDGRAYLHLRLDAPRNGRRQGIHWARDFLEVS